MDFGVSFQSHIGNSWKHAMLAEQMGFSNAWFVDTQMLASDVYACMALAAEHTSLIRLGTAVTIAGTRIAPVIAHSIATINQLAPGRVILGIGTGHTAWRAMGMQPMRLQTFRHAIEVCRGLLRGEEVEYHERGDIFGRAVVDNVHRRQRRWWGPAGAGARVPAVALYRV